MSIIHPSVNIVSLKKVSILKLNDNCLIAASYYFDFTLLFLYLNYFSEMFHMNGRIEFLRVICLLNSSVHLMK